MAKKKRQTKISTQPTLKHFHALVEIKKHYENHIPDYLKPFVNNNYLVSDTCNIIFTDRVRKTKKIKIFNFKPKHAKDFNLVKYKYWCKLFFCDKNCESHKLLTLLDNKWPDNNDKHFREDLVRIYVKELSGN